MMTQETSERSYFLKKNVGGLDLIDPSIKYPLLNKGSQTEQLYSS